LQENCAGEAGCESDGIGGWPAVIASRRLQGLAGSHVLLAFVSAVVVTT
jgi:hypothetical protein